MTESAFSQQPALLIPIILFADVTVVFVVWIIASTWKRVRQLNIEASLKQDMLTRGLSAADIERVMGASSAGTPAPEAKEVVTDNEYYLVEKMLDDGRPVEEIERLVRAFKGNGATASRTIEEIMRR